MFHWNWVRILWSLCAAVNVFFLYWLAGGSFEKGPELAMIYVAALGVYAFAYCYPDPMPGETLYFRWRDRKKENT